MISDNVTARLGINQDVRGGTEPAGTTIDLRVNAAGFFDPGGLGSAGQAPQVLSPQHVAGILTAHFDRDALRALLDQIVLLRDAL